MLKIGLWIFPFMTFLLGSTVIQFESDDVNWYTLSDGVMGGLSKGKIEYIDAGIRFEGAVSLENNGGFASIRSPWNAYDLEGVKAIKIRYRNSGQSFVMTMETEKTWYLPYYKAALPSSIDWVEKTLRLKDFEIYQVGRKKEGYMEVDQMNEVIRIGFMTNDKEASSFQLDIDHIELVK